MTDDVFSIAILAGGNSLRMGENKALLRIGELPLIEHVIRGAQKISPADLFIVTNTPDTYARFDLRMVADTIPHQGAISGIVSTLHHSLQDIVIVIACDLPFVQPALLTLLCDQLLQGKYQAVVPMLGDYPQAVLAVYHRSCLTDFQYCIDKGQRKLKTILRSLNNVHYMTEDVWRSIDPQGISFINVNTPQDLQDARILWEQLHDE